LLAEIGQVAEQAFFPRRRFLVPSITFAPPIRLPGLQQPTRSSHVLPAIISRAKVLLARHLERVRNS
jgi:hypothetical protein